MALHVPKAPGFAQMLKDGAKHYSGLEEAVFRNIQACKELAQTTRTAYGPNGMNKMVINHLEKLFVTNDAATILRELELTRSKKSNSDTRPRSAIRDGPIHSKSSD
ncbi:T-complex protein 1 subunit theta-like [Polyodon spathula]|uniref:T-complex protein 1 subunit theta-like n=1 Tax=Polyodon spathula TaxID=7913 RepID=UPI001B7DB657|nr:T-complex protein 1 subunit theta-like [Polyodon spathula]